MKLKPRIIIENEDELNEEEDVYSEDGRDHLVEDDEISLREAAFMQGYEES